MKKIVFTFMSLSLLAGWSMWTIFFKTHNEELIDSNFVSNDKKENYFPSEEDTVRTVESAVQKTAAKVAVQEEPVARDQSSSSPYEYTPPPVPPTPALDFSSIAEAQDFQKYFDQTEQTWRNTIRQMITQDMGLSPDVANRYDQLRAEYQDALVKGFEEFYSQLENNRDPDLDLNEVQQEIATNTKNAYLAKIRATLGDDNFSKYEATLNGYNGKLKEGKGPYIVIDL